MNASSALQLPILPSHDFLTLNLCTCFSILIAHFSCNFYMFIVKTSLLTALRLELPPRLRNNANLRLLQNKNGTEEVWASNEPAVNMSLREGCGRDGNLQQTSAHGLAWAGFLACDSPWELALLLHFLNQAAVQLPQRGALHKHFISQTWILP